MRAQGSFGAQRPLQSQPAAIRLGLRASGRLSARQNPAHESAREDDHIGRIGGGMRDAPARSRRKSASLLISKIL
jgi:hypothetical protein